MNRAINQSCGITSTSLTVVYLKFPNYKRGQKNIRIMTENFLNLIKTMNSQIQEF